MATKTRVSIRLEVGDRLAEPKGGYRIRMARGESESVEVSAELLDGGRPFDAAGLSARFMAVLAGGRHVAMPVPPEGVSGGTLTYTLPSGLGATPGDTRLAVFELSDGEGYRIYTEPFTVSVADGPSPTSAEIGPYVPELDALLAQLKAAIGSAGDAAETASSAAGKAEAAIAEVKATEAKLYPAAENILVGSETGTVAHVGDAFNGATLRGITVEGACKQDGTPSPEEPKPITVIEHPVVKIAGRNLIDVRSDMPESDCNKDFDSSIKRIILPGTYVVGLTMNNYLSANNIEDLSIGDGSISFTGKTVEYGVGIGVDLLPGETYIDKSTRYHSYYSKDGSFIKYDEGERFTVPADARYAVANFRAEEDNSSASAKNIAIAHVSDGGSYKPHTSQSLTFTLPAEHPYLAKLPDGTADEIVVNQEGNVELVARVGKVVFDGSQAFYEVQNGDIETYYETSNPIGTGVLDVAQWGGLFDRFETGNPYSQHSAICAYSFANINGVVFRVRPRETFANAGAFVDWLKSNPITSYYADTEPKTYQLGKIDMPKAQDNIVNVWVEAEVTPRTGIGYVRDVNIVVANLEAAIASIS